MPAAHSYNVFYSCYGPLSPPIIFLVSPQESEAPLAMSAGRQSVSIDVQSVDSLAHYRAASPSPTKHQVRGFLAHNEGILWRESLCFISRSLLHLIISLYHHSLPQDLLDEILQLTLCKYRGRPHWALSTNRMLFSAGLCESTVHKYGGERFGLFMERRLRYDPEDLFLNPAFVKIIGEAEPERYPGRHCSLLEFICVLCG